jgi:Cft2 family RNA processing exonuclease
VRKHIFVHLEVLGSADVGASCLVLAAAGRRNLIDAGVCLGSAKGGTSALAGDVLPDLARLQEDGGIDAVIVTHSHSDHIGSLPLAVTPFPAAPILATPATCALKQVMLADALRIAEGRWHDTGELPAFDVAAVCGGPARAPPPARLSRPVPPCLRPSST